MNTPDHTLRYPGGRICFLLIHGLGGTPLEMKFVAQGLARRGNAVECVQLAAHCGSLEDLRESTWQQWYESVAAAHTRLRRSYDSVIVGGLSMGAVLALHLAGQRPAAVDGLVLLAPTLVLNGWSMPWYSFLLRFVRPTFMKLDYNLKERPPYGLKDERVRAFVARSMQSGDSAKAGMLATPIRAFAEFNRLVAVVRRELSRIHTPALILHPRHDDMAGLTNSLHLQRCLAGPVHTVVLDDSYHIVTLDRQRHIVVERADAFAREIAGERVDSTHRAPPARLSVLT